MVPALTGASVVAVKDLLDVPNFVQYLPPLAVGTVVSLVVGLLCIHWLLGFLAKQSMAVFAVSALLLVAVPGDFALVLRRSFAARSSPLRSSRWP